MRVNICLRILAMCNLFLIVLYIYEFRTTEVSLNDCHTNLFVKNIITK